MTVILLHLITLAVGIAGGYLYAWATLTRTRRSPMSTRKSAPSWLRSPVPANVLLIVVSLFLTVVAVVTYVGKQQDAAQNDRLCAVVDDMGKTLTGRSAVYRAGAEANISSDRADLAWKRQVRKLLIGFGGKPGDPLIRATDQAISKGQRGIAKESAYLRALQANPVPRVQPEDCQ